MDDIDNFLKKLENENNLTNPITRQEIEVVIRMLTKMPMRTYMVLLMAIKEMQDIFPKGNV